MTRHDWIHQAAKFMLDIKFMDRYDQAIEYAEGLACDYYCDNYSPDEAVLEDLSYYD